MLLITLEILTHIRFLRVFVYEYLMYCWLVWTKRATSCFIDIGCSLMLSRICLWSFPLAWAHWKITRCGFILFFYLACLFCPLFPLFSIILVFAFLPTRHMAINPSYRCDSKACAYSYEFQQRNQTLQNSGIAITIWDLERIVQGACQLFMHSLNLFIVLQNLKGRMRIRSVASRNSIIPGHVHWGKSEEHGICLRKCPWERTWSHHWKNL